MRRFVSTNTAPTLARRGEWSKLHEELRKWPWKLTQDVVYVVAAAAQFEGLNMLRQQYARTSDVATTYKGYFEWAFDVSPGDLETSIVPSVLRTRQFDFLIAFLM